MSNVNVPGDRKYTTDHEWAKKEGDGGVRIGITAFAVEQLGDITLVDLPKVGEKVEVGKSFGTVESVKTLSDLFAPISGVVVAVNEALTNQPELVNEGTYDTGWMIVITPSDAAFDALLDAPAYDKHVSSLDH